MLLLSSPLLSFLLVSKVGVVRVGVLLLAGDREAGRRRQAGGGGRPRRGTEGAADEGERPGGRATGAAGCRRQRGGRRGGSGGSGGNVGGGVSA